MQARLISQDNRQTYIIDKPVYRIGREKAFVDCCLSDPAVSRCHCDIINRNGQYFLLDVQSTNGTYKNGTRVPPGKEVLLTDGDEVRLANVRFRFEEALW